MIPLLGGPGHAIVNSFSGAMLVAGGSGITYALSTVQELITKSAESASRARVVELVWCITDPGEPSLPPPYLRVFILGTLPLTLLLQLRCSPSSRYSAACSRKRKARKRRCVFRCTTPGRSRPTRR